MNNYRYQIKVACAWRIAAELMRRHHAQSHLRLILAHPCGGQVRQLWVVQDDPSLNPATEFFLPKLGLSYSDGSAHLLGSAEPPSRDSVLATYIGHLLSDEDPKAIVDQLEREIGLPEITGQLPSSSPAVLVSRVIAGVLSRYCFSRKMMEAECGWTDTAGYSSGIDERLRQFKWISDNLAWSQEDENWPLRARSASKFWLLGPLEASDHDARVVLSLGGRCATISKPDDPIDLWDLYKSSGRTLQPVVDKVSTMLGVAP